MSGHSRGWLIACAQPETGTTPLGCFNAAATAGLTKCVTCPLPTCPRPTALQLWLLQCSAVQQYSHSLQHACAAAASAWEVCVNIAVAICWCYGLGFEWLLAKHIARVQLAPTHQAIGTNACQAIYPNLPYDGLLRHSRLKAVGCWLRRPCAACRLLEQPCRPYYGWLQLCGSLRCCAASKGSFKLRVGVLYR
jgi:hypothetical protein